MSLEAFKVKMKATAKRNEFLSCLLADLLIVDYNAGLIITKCNVTTAGFVYKKYYFEKTIKQIGVYMAVSGLKCEIHDLGLTVTLKNCTIQIFKEDKI